MTTLERGRQVWRLLQLNRQDGRRNEKYTGLGKPEDVEMTGLANGLQKEK